MSLLKRIAPLYSGWEETLIWSVLEGHMGYALADDEETPTSALVVVGDICFFAGRPDDAIAAKAGAPEMIPQHDGWCASIERVWGEKVQRRLRYAIKKEPDVFHESTLQYYVDSLPEQYELRLFDEAIYAQSFADRWSRDFCSNFQDCNDFLSRGLGVAVLHEGALVSGASSYTVYNGGFEIEIDTKPEYRQQGLATICGAKLILEALQRGLYPSWDAYDLRSVALAEKLGYHVDHPYTVYSMV